MVERDESCVAREKHFEELALKVKEGHLALKVGARGASAELCVHVVLKERATGGRLFFSVMSLYSVLQLKQYTCQATKWFYSQHEA